MASRENRDEAPNSSNDLSPSEFVQSIRELGSKKDKEDQERLAGIERDILQGRKEREARRAGESCLFFSFSLFVLWTPRKVMWCYGADAITTS